MKSPGRIIRTARRLGVRTIAVYSSADAQAPFVREADQAVAIGAAPARDSYLNGARILAAAASTGAQAIHPGYGFLSENAAFAQSVQDAGLLWVGAPPAAIRAMGLKDAAKALMLRAGVPVTPGYMGADTSLARLQREAETIGYPILIKAVAGGGGKGMRRVDAAPLFDAALASCQREAAAAFGDDRVLLEKYVRAPRHLEVQVFGDTHGNVVHLFERDCSLQRRHQKVIEEAPAPGLDAATRAFLCDTAVKAAAAVNYVGAGTIEFIADASQGLAPDRIWFMEMNTRLQVEHAVTEAITGEDLVEWQLRIAGGEPLPRRQDQLHIDGCAIEARLYAEEPATGFLPSTGPLLHLVMPDGLRVDSAVEQGDDVTGFYDPMLAKIIAHAPTRSAAIAKLADGCEQVEVWPVHTNAAFLARALRHPRFIAGDIDTGFIEAHARAVVPVVEPSLDVIAIAAAALREPSGEAPWSTLSGFRCNSPAYGDVSVAIGGHNHLVALEGHGDLLGRGSRTACIQGEQVLFVRGAAWRYSAPAWMPSGGGAPEADGRVHAPMPGRIVGVMARTGQPVVQGQPLVALEAMKMELVLKAPFAGTLSQLAVAAGDQVSEGALLAHIVRES